MDLQKRKDILDGEGSSKDFFDNFIKEIDGEIDKAGEEFESIQKAVMNLIDEMKPKLYFAKTDDKAIIPSKRDEDAGYDIYSLIQPRETSEGLVYEQYLEKNKVNKIKTGIASAVNKDYYLSLNSERSSIAKHGINVLAGTIDSGYRGEIMLMVVPLVKDVLISSMVDEVEEHEELIVIPYKKAIAQATLLPVPDVQVEELTYDELLEIESERGTGGWGSSGK